MNRAWSTIALAPVLLGAAPQPAADMLLIRHAHVFDGSGAPAQIRDVLIRDGRIAEVSGTIRRPRAARLIDGRGMTLLPGLHDLHTHMRSPGYDAPEDMGKAHMAYLSDGVTTVNEFSVYGEMLRPIRRMTQGKPVPHLKLAVRLSTTGGHGTEYGWGRDFTGEVDTARAAHAAMARLLPYRPDVIKVFTDGWRYGKAPSLTSMDLPTLSAIVTDAHARNIPVITHTVTLEGARIAAAAGVDALGHGIGDKPVDADLIALMKARGTAYIPTLAVYEPQGERRWTPGEAALQAPGEKAAEDAAENKIRENRVTEDRARVGSEAPDPREAGRWAIMRANVASLAAAGIPIGVGTDAGIGGVYHGVSALHELALLTSSGLTPAQALVAGTATSAAILHEERESGRIAPGMRADLVMVAGRPDLRIEDIANVRHVFLAGKDVDRAALRKIVAGDAMSPLPTVAMAGPIDDGRSPDGRTALGTMLVATYDRGIDHSDILVARTRGADAQPMFALVRMGVASEPFGRLVVPLTPGGIALADASPFTGIAFTVRGEGDYRLLPENYGVDGKGQFSVAFTATSDATEIRLPFASFTSPNAAARLDRRTLRQLLFEIAGPSGSSRWLELRNLRFYHDAAAGIW